MSSHAHSFPEILQPRLQVGQRRVASAAAGSRVAATARGRQRRRRRAAASSTPRAAAAAADTATPARHGGGSGHLGRRGYRDSPRGAHWRRRHLSGRGV